MFYVNFNTARSFDILLSTVRKATRTCIVGRWLSRWWITPYHRPGAAMTYLVAYRLSFTPSSRVRHQTRQFATTPGDTCWSWWRLPPPPANISRLDGTVAFRSQPAADAASRQMCTILAELQVLRILLTAWKDAFWINLISRFHLMIWKLITRKVAKMNKYQLSLTDPRDALRHGERAANK